MKITSVLITEKTKGFMLMAIGHAVITPEQKVALGDPWPYSDYVLGIIKDAMKDLCGDLGLDAEIVVQDRTIVLVVHSTAQETS